MAQIAAKYVAYLRVSTSKQGKSGLGLEAQRDSVTRFVTGRDGRIIAEHVEVETGKRNDRPELSKALKRCRTTGATLIVAKLDRLSRNAAFLMTLRDSGVDFVAVDMPDANTLTIGVMASLAQHEREVIGKRTRDALAAAKARGQRLGGLRPGAADISRYQREGVAAAKERAMERLSDIAEDLRSFVAQGLSLNAIARRLNADDVKGSRGGTWTATAVRRALGRI